MFKPKNISTFKNNIMDENRSLIRHVRQVIVGTILGTEGIVTSIWSIFTSTEVISMSYSQDSENELIGNNNNIITSLQARESAIHRNEESINQIKTHLKKFGKGFIN